MSLQCLRCGKQLGSTVVFCHSCWTDVDDPQSDDRFDVDVYERVREYFIIAAFRCSKCGSLHTTVSVDGKSVSASDYAIDSLDEWRDTLQQHEEWIQSRTEAVQAVLPALVEEWPRSTAMLRQTVLSE